MLSTRILSLWFLVVTGAIVLWSTESWAQFRPTRIRVEQALKPKKYALVIGISRSIRTTFWPTLKYAKQDATRMSNALRRVGQFDRILMLSSSQETTKASILSALLRIKSWVKHKEDTVVVYISAHGSIGKGRVRYIITSDTTQTISRTGLSVNKVRSILHGFLSRRIGLILATCYTGVERSKSVRVPGIKGKVVPRPFRGGRAIQILSAASYAQPAFESSRFQADVYTHFFLQCLRALPNKTIIKVHVCAAQKTTPFVQQLNGEVQVPKAYSEVGANRDFSLASDSSAQKLGYFRSRWRKGRAWRMELFRARSKSTVRVASTQDNEMIALKPGRYRVLIRDSEGRIAREQEISVRASQVSRLYTDWVLDLQGGSFFSAAGGTSFLSGGSLGIHHRFFAIRLGLWGTSRTYAFSQSSTQLYLSLRGEGGYRWEWNRFELFLGGYVTLGLMMSHVLHNTQTLSSASLLGLGATIQACYWLTAGVGIHLQGGGGITLVPRAQVDVLPDATVRVGLSFRL